MRKFVLAILFVIVIAGLLFWYLGRGLENKLDKTAQVMAQKITLTTSDGKTIIGDYAGKSGQPAVLMLHMMPATRSSWREFSEKLNTSGFQTLAIDLRGHGESSGGPEGWKRFSDEEHQASIHDVEAGMDFIKSKNPSKIFITGASLGANLALEYAATHHDIQGVILLSPGLDYRGVKTETAVRNLRSGQGVYYAASRDDPYSAETVGTLSRAGPVGAKKEIKIFDKAGHGTTIFEREPAFMGELVGWLENLLQ